MFANVLSHGAGDELDIEFADTSSESCSSTWLENDFSTLTESISLQFNNHTADFSIDNTGQHICTGSPIGVSLYSLETPFVPGVVLCNENTKLTRFNPSSSHYSSLLGVSDLSIFVIDIERKTSIGQYAYQNYEKSVTDVQWNSLEPFTYASVSSDMFIRLWDTRQSNPTTINCWGASGADRVAWSCFNSFVFATTHMDEIRVWDTRKSSYMFSLVHHTMDITSIDFSKTNPDHLVSSSIDGTVVLHDLISPDSTYFRVPVDSPVRLVSTTPFGDGFVTVSDNDDSRVRLWSVRNLEAELVDVFQASGHVKKLDWRCSTEATSPCFQIGLLSADNTGTLWPLERSMISEFSNQLSPVKLHSDTYNPNDRVSKWDTDMNNLNGPHITNITKTGFLSCTVYINCSRISMELHILAKPDYPNSPLSFDIKDYSGIDADDIHQLEVNANSYHTTSLSLSYISDSISMIVQRLSELSRTMENNPMHDLTPISKVTATKDLFSHGSIKLSPSLAGATFGPSGRLVFFCNTSKLHPNRMRSIFDDTLGTTVVLRDFSYLLPFKKSLVYDYKMTGGTTAMSLNYRICLENEFTKEARLWSLLCSAVQLKAAAGSSIIRSILGLCDQQTLSIFGSIVGKPLSESIVIQTAFVNYAKYLKEIQAYTPLKVLSLHINPPLQNSVDVFSVDVSGTICGVCRLQVKFLAMACWRCGHGGHCSHLRNWFDNNFCCPSGCGCVCVF